MGMEVMPMTIYESINLLLQLSAVFLTAFGLLLSLFFFSIKKK